MTTQEARKIREIMETAAQSLDDRTALEAVCLYPRWTAGVAYTAAFKVQHEGKLYKCVQAHTGQSDWTPTAAASLWTQINETQTGTLEDPIPYDNNMELTEGLYYSQDGVTYRCTRSTGQPVYNALSELVGLYVEAV